jgi:hypothetical protein
LDVTLKLKSSCGEVAEPIKGLLIEVFSVNVYPLENEPVTTAAPVLEVVKKKSVPSVPEHAALSHMSAMRVALAGLLAVKATARRPAALRMWRVDLFIV